MTRASKIAKMGDEVREEPQNSNCRRHGYDEADPKKAPHFLGFKNFNEAHDGQKPSIS